MDLVEYDICRTQARIYRYIASQGYDLPIFSDAYLTSDFCRRAFDTIYSRFQVADELECLDFIFPEINEKLVKNNTWFDEDVAYWIGFTYRQCYIETEIPSRELASRISFASMCRYYPGLHTLDENEALEIICRDYEIHRK